MTKFSKEDKVFLIHLTRILMRAMYQFGIFAAEGKTNSMGAVLMHHGQALDEMERKL